MELPRIDIEREMREVVREIGGTVLADELPHPDFENADFVFHQEKVIAELKCATEDNIRSDSNEAKVRNLWRRCFVKGLVNNRTTNEQDWRRLPKSVQNQFYHVQTQSIRRRAQKANRQIRETKVRLNIPDYRGLLIIANDGITSITPPAFIHATQLALKNDFREIRHFVFLTANIFVREKGMRIPRLLWISFDMEDGSKIETPFLDRFGAAWRARHQQFTGALAIEEELDDIERFWGSVFVRPRLMQNSSHHG